jgi:hypothetical protein
VHGVFFAQRNQPPVELVFYVPDRTNFQFWMYHLPYEWSNAKFMAYCIARDRYMDAGQTLNMTNRGLFLILRNSALNVRNCPGINEWEDSARESAEGIAASKSAYRFARINPDVILSSRGSILHVFQLARRFAVRIVNSFAYKSRYLFVEKESRIRTRPTKKATHSSNNPITIDSPERSVF